MKTAIIGCGVIGDVHVKVTKAQNKNVVALCDLVEQKTEYYRENFFPQAKTYLDWKKMIAETRPNVVHICTPHYLHTQMILYCLERDIHVLCEKPLCIKTEDIPLILEAERKSNAQLGICFQHRYNPVNVYVKERLKEMGEVSGFGSVVWHKDKKYYQSDEWRGTWAQEGGGALINQAIHTLDLLEWFVGVPEYVTAHTENLSLKGVIEVEDSATCVYSGGHNFTLFATNAADIYFPIEITLMNQTNRLTVFLDSVLDNGKPIDFAKDERILGKKYYGTWHESLIADYYDCIENGRKFPIDGSEASKAVKLVLAAYRSNGQKITIE